MTGVDSRNIIINISFRVMMLRKFRSKSIKFFVFFGLWRKNIFGFASIQHKFSSPSRGKFDGGFCSARLRDVDSNNSHVKAHGNFQPFA